MYQIDDKTKLECLMHLATMERQKHAEETRRGWQIFMTTLTFFVLSTGAILENQIVFFPIWWINVLALWALFCLVAVMISLSLQRIRFRQRTAGVVITLFEGIIIHTTLTAEENVDFELKKKIVWKDFSRFNKYFNFYHVQIFLVYTFAIVASVILTFGVFIK